MEELIIEYTLNGIKGANICETVTVLEIALKLVKALPSWDAERALRVIMGGDESAE